VQDDAYWSNVRKLEDALLEYVERYGLTEKAREALTASEVLRNRARDASGEDPDPGRKD
jgi:hypothetical protein